MNLRPKSSVSEGIDERGGASLQSAGALPARQWAALPPGAETHAASCGGLQGSIPTGISHLMELTLPPSCVPQLALFLSQGQLPALAQPSLLPPAATAGLPLKGLGNHINGLELCYRTKL